MYRNSAIELIRIIAVVLIVFTHTRNNIESGWMLFVFERIPLLGTAVLSVISGYLFYNVSRNKKKLLQRKIKSLLIPYLIANGLVLVLVLIFNFIFGYNPLNRLSMDYTIITEGLFSLNSPPINPPTYFIRDIFIIFAIISLVLQRELKSIFFLLPFVLFGSLILRYDVVALFLAGGIFAKYKTKIKQYIWIGIFLFASIVVLICCNNYLKFPLSLLILVSVVDLKFKFPDVGRYSYLLHLYHSPVIVITYPIINTFVETELLKLILQIIVSLIFVYILFLFTRSFKFLKILSGGR